MLRIIPYSLYAGDSIAAYLSKQHRCGLAFVGAWGHFAQFRKTTPAEQPYSVVYLNERYTCSRHFVQGGLTPYIQVLPENKTPDRNQLPAKIRQSLKLKTAIYGVLLLAIAIFCAVFYVRAVHQSSAELRTWSMLTGFLLIPGALLLLVLMVDSLVSLRLIERKGGGGWKWPCWFAMFAVILLYIGQPIVSTAIHNRVPNKAFKVYSTVSETWRPYRSSSILERTDCIATGRLAQGTMQLVYHDTILHDAYLSAWQQECANGRLLATDSISIAYQIAPGSYTATFPMEEEIYILYVSNAEEDDFLETVDLICRELYLQINR